MKKQYIVLPKDKKERKDFYNYLMNNGYYDLEDYLEERYINSHFPFVIESDKSFWHVKVLHAVHALLKTNK